MQYVVECAKISDNVTDFVRFIYPDVGAYQMLSDELLQLGPKISVRACISESWMPPILEPDTWARGLSASQKLLPRDEAGE